VIDFIGSSGRTRTYNPSVNRSPGTNFLSSLLSVTTPLQPATDSGFRQRTSAIGVLPIATGFVGVLTECTHKSPHIKIKVAPTFRKVAALVTHTGAAPRNHP
jgi:hypothetical protein